MRQTLYFIFAMIGGLVLHQTSSVTRKMPTGFQELFGTAIGVEGTFPFFVMFLKRMGFSREKIFKASLAYQVVFLCVGCGVALGWMIDTLFNIERGEKQAESLPK